MATRALLWPGTRPRVFLPPLSPLVRYHLEHLSICYNLQRINSTPSCFITSKSISSSLSHSTTLLRHTGPTVANHPLGQSRQQTRLNYNHFWVGIPTFLSRRLNLKVPPSYHQGTFRSRFSPSPHLFHPHVTLRGPRDERSSFGRYPPGGW